MASTTTGPPARFPSRRRRAQEEPQGEQTTVEPYRLTPKLARRVALLSALVVIGFAVLVMRLWALQVLSGSQYAARAQANQVRTVSVQAPRGTILDSTGHVLVANQPVTSVELSLSGLPRDYRARAREIRTLAQVTGVGIHHITKLLVGRRVAGDMLDPVVVRTQATGPMLTYLEERAADFPGLTLARNYIRRYPDGSVAAQLLGYDGQTTKSAGQVIGLTGIEAAFNKFLGGVPGQARVRVDSLGRPQSPRLLTTPPQQGQTVRLTLDAKLQVAAQNALNDGVQRARNDGQWAADGGAIVALNPQDGSILALASSPTYNPSVYSGRITDRKLAAQGLIGKSAFAKNYPSLDRAVDGTYPPGSTFKPLTAIAALEEHLIKPYAFYPCTGTYVAPQDSSKHVWHNWDLFVNEGMNLPTAIAQSCDTYFYGLGDRFYALPKDRGQPIQKWARRFGFGQESGSDLGPQSAGLVPTIGYLHQRFTKRNDPNWKVDQFWKPGDSLNLSIGQGNLTVTPLQMARFYAALANGGKLVTPHILQDVENPNGTPVPTKAPAAPRPVQGLNPADLKVVQQGLFMGTHDPLGTSYGVFGQFPVPIAGKTGTAQKQVHVQGFSGERDQSWWCGYGPANEATTPPKLVVCAVIENGGEGGAAAAPAAARVFAKFFNVPVPPTTPHQSD
ncbi:MAG TPA: penicillin-binding protein 2 [Gaiellaceae bacterium]|nr:penicillin-binding protein 2 [Gaiellaceae bacterium]